MSEGVLCQCCGIEAPTRSVDFRQNIGVLVMRFQSRLAGNVCKHCLHKKFWSMTLVTLLVGWLGIISLILAPIFILNNLINYLCAIAMPPVPTGASVPQIDEQVMARFMPVAGEAFGRVNAEEDLDVVAREIAPRLQMTPGQVIRCMIALSELTKRQAMNQLPTGGFPIVMPQPMVAASPAPAQPAMPPPPPIAPVAASAAPAQAESPTLGL